MRLRIGVELPFAKNALVYAKNLNVNESKKAEDAINLLRLAGIHHGQRVGSGFFSGSLVLRLDLS